MEHRKFVIMCQEKLTQYLGGWRGMNNFLCLLFFLFSQFIQHFPLKIEV